MRRAQLRFFLVMDNPIGLAPTRERGREGENAQLGYAALTPPTLATLLCQNFATLRFGGLNATGQKTDGSSSPSSSRHPAQYQSYCRHPIRIPSPIARQHRSHSCSLRVRPPSTASAGQRARIWDSQTAARPRPPRLPQPRCSLRAPRTQALSNMEVVDDRIRLQIFVADKVRAAAALAQARARPLPR